jgi:hypothetical protein
MGMEVRAVDLRPITCDVDRYLTRVVLFREPLRGSRLDWMLLGRANLRPSGNDHRPGCWELSAYMPATDPYHDRAYAAPSIIRDFPWELEMLVPPREVHVELRFVARMVVQERRELP